MALTPQQLHLASLIDDHVNRVLRDGGGDEALLCSLYEYMDAFKRLMDTTTQEEMHQLTERYAGFYRFAKLLETLAQAIADGRIQVPK